MVPLMFAALEFNAVKLEIVVLPDKGIPIKGLLFVHPKEAPEGMLEKLVTGTVTPAQIA